VCVSKQQRLSTQGRTLILHRHFDLSAGEMLVEYNDTSTPWPLEGIDGMKPPHPSIWSRSLDGSFRPVEFRYSNHIEGGDIGEKEVPFMEEFHKLLQQHGAPDVFGLCPGDDFDGTCEITQGRANINLAPADVGLSYISKLHMN